MGACRFIPTSTEVTHMTSPFPDQYHLRTRTGRAVALAVALFGLIVILAIIGAPSARAADPCVGPECDSVAFVDANARFTLYSDTTVGSGVHRMYFGNPGDEPLMGDWNCDGETTPAMYRRSTGLMYLRNTNTQGTADMQYYFGSPGDIPIAGDFNGDGCDTVSIYRPSDQRFYITNTLGGGVAEYFFTFGNPGDLPFVGDFDGDGTDTVGLHRKSTGRVYFTNERSTNKASADFVFGDPGDIVFAGDWNGDGRDSVGLYRPSNGTTYLSFKNAAGPADISFYVGPYANAIPTKGLPTYKGVVTAFDIDVEVYPGDNLESLARSKPAGTVFRLNGTISGQNVEPKDGQIFVGAAGARMDGRGSERHAFRSSARNVQIHGIEITNYATDIQDGTVQAMGDGWIIMGNEIHHNTAVGVKIYKADGAAILDNHIHHNEQMGISVAYSTDSFVENNEIAYNNWEAKHRWGFEAGGTKFWATTRLIVRGNFSHHNHGPGLWTDHDNIGTLYEGNLVEDNLASGIFHEISYDATIRNNTVRRNGFGQDAWLWGGGITLSSSGGVTITGNRVEDNYNGITMVQQSRGSGAYGPYTTRNNVVTGNVIIDSGRSGAAEDIGSKKIFSDGNDFQKNTYSGGVDWEWGGGRVSWSTWRGYGLDASGSFKP
jgi:parallel beta-helix repeat protein